MASPHPLLSISHGGFTASSFPEPINDVQLSTIIAHVGHHPNNDDKHRLLGNHILRIQTLSSKSYLAKFPPFLIMILTTIHHYLAPYYCSLRALRALPLLPFILSTTLKPSSDVASSSFTSTIPLTQH